MAEPARKLATYQDVLDAPPEQIAQVIAGELYLHARPARRHIRAASSLGAFLISMFDGVWGGGPGGWVILAEPELHLGGDILAPDRAGWRESHFPDAGERDEAYIAVAPDWVCELLSDGTARIDRMTKVPIYARERIPHVWLVDPRDRTVEVLELTPQGYRLVGTWGGDEGPSAMPPFEAVPVPVDALWGRALRR